MVGLSSEPEGLTSEPVFSPGSPQGVLEVFLGTPGQGYGGLGYLASQTWLHWALGVKSFELDPGVVTREPLKVSKRH